MKVGSIQNCIHINYFFYCRNPRISSALLSSFSPLSRSHSGEDAPLHSLRGPRTGEMRPKSDSETVLGRSRLQGLEGSAGEDEEDEEEGEGEAQEDALVNGHGDSVRSWGLQGDEPRLQVERVSESSSDTMLPLTQGSSSKQSEVTA